MAQDPAAPAQQALLQYLFESRSSSSGHITRPENNQDLPIKLDQTIEQMLADFADHQGVQVRNMKVKHGDQQLDVKRTLASYNFPGPVVKLQVYVGYG